MKEIARQGSTLETTLFRKTYTFIGNRYQRQATTCKGLCLSELVSQPVNSNPTCCLIPKKGNHTFQTTKEMAKTDSVSVCKGETGIYKPQLLYSASCMFMSTEQTQYSNGKKFLKTKQLPQCLKRMRHIVAQKKHSPTHSGFEDAVLLL